MARIDKFDPKTGGYRATLAADWPAEQVEKVVGVGHDADGRVVIGGGQTGVKGVVILTKSYKAGTRIDVMTAGEVIEFELDKAGAEVFAGGDGTVSDAAGGVYVGHTVEPTRLIIRFGNK